jgi:hypothetical protein
MLNLLIPLYSQDVCRKLFLDQSLLWCIYNYPPSPINISVLADTMKSCGLRFPFCSLSFM